MKKFSQYLESRESLAIDSLARFSRHYEDFKDFEKSFLVDLNHGYYWHLTDDPHFSPDPHKGSRDMSSMGGGKIKEPGSLMVTTHLDHWDDYYNDSGHGVSRPYAALLDLSNLDPRRIRQVNRGFGNEIYLDPELARNVRVVEVMPIERAKQVDRRLHSTLPGSSQELMDIWKRRDLKESLQAMRFGSRRSSPTEDEWRDSGERHDPNWIYQYDRPVRDDEVERIHSNYEKSMNRRRPGVALDFKSFSDRVNDENTYNFRFGDSYVFGAYRKGIFFPTHFSPSSLREGSEMLKELLKHDVAWLVTPDLSGMIQSLGYIKIMSDVPVNFRGSTVYKDVLVSNRGIASRVRKMYS